MITPEKLNSAKFEAIKFIEAVQNLEGDGFIEYGGYGKGSLTATVKRRSHDLSRVLTELRKP